MSKKERYVVRLLMLGDSGAGKSTLLLRYVQNGFEAEHMPTIGIDFRLKTIELDNKMIKVQVWDTAGQERFRTITHNYYRGAHGILLAYDVTKIDSFENIRKWISDVRTYAEENVNLVLIGNKCDLVDSRVVQRNRGEKLANEYGIPFFETSAKEDICVIEAFDSLVRTVCKRKFGEKKKKEEEKEVRLEQPGEKKSCCGK
uniref:Ras-related protein Rab-1 n=1 Tax=Lotharella globosa TaxID=91324 RepID=A0A7S3Y9X0_9EUKA|mmetsp:Transcript_22617/g.45450  ORF Transcript_22617/g.45450 Transcript_22617/m.45450 type:complete len:201 (-) Transcript_22617:180-782(-)